MRIRKNKPHVLFLIWKEGGSNEWVAYVLQPTRIVRPAEVGQRNFVRHLCWWYYLPFCQEFFCQQFCHSARKYAVSVRNLCGFNVCLILSLSMKIKRSPWARIKPLFLGDRWLRCFCCPFLWDKSYPILSLTSGGNGTHHEWCDWLTRKLPHQWRSGGDNSQNMRISYNCIRPLTKTVERFVVEILKKLN